MFTDNVLSADNQQERLPKEIIFLNYYLAGFVDGEGCFSVTICKHKYARFGWKIDPLFQVYQHKDNASILYIFKEVFKCGYVSKKGGNPSCFVYCVDKIEELITIVIPFFEKYPLIGEKYENFLLFKKIVFSLQKKQHFTKNGFKTLVNTAFQMNKAGKYRKNSKEKIYASLEESSETIRQTAKKI
jgi:hypothetical protein